MSLATVSAVGGTTQIRFFPYDPDGENAVIHIIKEQTLTDLFDNDKLALKDQHQVLKIATRMLTANIESSNYEVQVKETE